MLDALIKKLDLHEHIEALSALFARKKSLTLEGDLLLHYKHIQALIGAELKEPPNLKPFAGYFARLSKYGTLHIDELFEIATQIRYLLALKQTELKEPVASLFRGYEVPAEVLATLKRFDDEGNINPSYDEELYELLQAIKSNKTQIKQSLHALTKNRKLEPFLVDSAIHLYNGEESLLVRSGFSQAIDAKVVGRSGAMHFYIIPRSIQTLKAKEERLKQHVDEIYIRHAKEISASFSKHLKFLRYSDKLFDRFDHYQVRARFATYKDLHFLLPNASKEIVLSRFEHPALNDPTPLDVAFEKKILLVTGVNAGGKTMLLKSILGAALMSRYLIPFRCDPKKSRIGTFEKIEAIIEDPQSVKNDISTFAGRMRAFSKLFALKGALIGVDEIELGTDSDEAAALFKVLLDALKAQGNYFVITTHHKRLAALMGADEEVELVAAVYDEKQEAPTYSFMQGIVGKSYAFETAIRYGIDREIIDKARRLYGHEQARLSELIERSSELEMKLRRKLNEVQKQLQAIELQKEQLQQKEEALKKQFEKQKATLENRYNAAIKRALQAAKSKEASQSRRLINEAVRHKELAKKAKTDPKKVNFNVGERVIFGAFSGEVIAIKGEVATIQKDGIKLKAPLHKLKRIDPPKKSASKPKLTTASHHIEKGSASVSLKLLGKRSEEAIVLLDKFINDALLHGLSEVEIIHGVGTGALQRTCDTFLKQHPRVKDFYRAKGNFGATIVQL